VGAAFLPKLFHVVTVSDACAAVNLLFRLLKSHLGTKRMLSSNLVRCADHSVLCGVLVFILAQQVKEINKKLRASVK
jgi:hypothetical protein